MRLLQAYEWRRECLVNRLGYEERSVLELCLLSCIVCPMKNNETHSCVNAGRVR